MAQSLCLSLTLRRCGRCRKTSNTFFPGRGWEPLSKCIWGCYWFWVFSQHHLESFVVKVFSDSSPFILKWNLQAFIIVTTSTLTLKVPYRIFWSNLILLTGKNPDPALTEMTRLIYLQWQESPNGMGFVCFYSHSNGSFRHCALT